jgi:hypothetical protein
MTCDLRVSEMYDAWDNDEISTSMARAVFLSTRKMLQRRELTKDEERLFAAEVRRAKVLELVSFCENDAFEFAERASLPVRPQTGRWMLTWKMTMSSSGEESWSVKARLVIRGFEDTQGSELRVRSPTAGRTGQRLVLSVAALLRWEIVSCDIPTAFLQGNRLDGETTSSGRDRVAAMTPPADAWDLLPSGWRLWPGTDQTSLAWRLLVAVYGLKDGPKLFIDFLTSWVIGEGWEQSMMDEQVFYLRELPKKGNSGARRVLVAILSIHMDDLAMAGTPPILDHFIIRLKFEFGKHAEVKVQRILFRHLGFRYEWLRDYSVTMDLQQYIRDAKFAEVEGPPDTELPPKGVSSLRGVNGTLSYGTGGRPEAMGCVAESASAVGVSPDGEGPTWAKVIAANAILQWLKDTNSESRFWYPAMGDGTGFKPGETSTKFVLIVLTDAAFGNLLSRHSQLGYTILLAEVHDPTQLGGRVHLLEFGSSKSPRVCTSTFSGELHGAIRGLERGRFLVQFLTELWGGARTPEELLNDVPVVTLEAVIDAKGLFDAMTAASTGKITDRSSILYLLQYREAMRVRHLSKLHWAPTESMLADDLTKAMLWGSGLWPILYEHAYWQPFRREDLPEDWVSWTQDGAVTRYQLGRVVAELPPRPASSILDVAENDDSAARL